VNYNNNTANHGHCLRGRERQKVVSVGSEVDRACIVNNPTGRQGFRGWVRGDDEGNMAGGGTDKVVRFVVVDFLDVICVGGRSRGRSLSMTSMMSMR
jgi:hypothetical protein